MLLHFAVPSGLTHIIFQGFFNVRDESVTDFECFLAEDRLPEKGLVVHNPHDLSHVA